MSFKRVPLSMNDLLRKLRSEDITIWNADQAKELVEHARQNGFYAKYHQPYKKPPYVTLVREKIRL